MTPVQAPAAQEAGLLDGPFRVVPGNLQHSIVGANNRAIAAAYGTHTEQAERAEHIARCLNCHAELVEALRELTLASVEASVTPRGPTPECRASDARMLYAREAARAALSRATGSAQ